MEAIDVIVIAIISAILTGFIYYRKNNRIIKIQRRYMELVHQSPEDAEKSLELQLSNYRKKYPRKTEEWYLEKIIEDLENDRR
ncbi:MAG: hypothetical protein ACOX2E_04605 [Syntrophaceticus sp.]|jgi:hypothetical protein